MRRVHSYRTVDDSRQVYFPGQGIGHLSVPNSPSERTGTRSRSKAPRTSMPMDVISQCDRMTTRFSGATGDRCRFSRDDVLRGQGCTEHGNRRRWELPAGRLAAWRVSRSSPHRRQLARSRKQNRHRKSITLVPRKDHSLGSRTPPIDPAGANDRGQGRTTRDSDTTM